MTNLVRFFIGDDLKVQYVNVIVPQRESIVYITDDDTPYTVTNIIYDYECAVEAEDDYDTYVMIDVNLEIKKSLDFSINKTGKVNMTGTLYEGEF